jgi:hypothetical protein
VAGIDQQIAALLGTAARPRHPCCCGSTAPARSRWSHSAT